MTLNDMSAKYAEKTGNALGFGVKSNKSGNSFVAIAKAVNGDFVIQSTADKKKIFTVSGSVDRYSFTEGGGMSLAASGGAAKKLSKREMLTAKLTQLQTKETELENTMSSVESQIEGLESDYSALEDSLSEVQDEISSLESDIDDLED